MDLRINTNPVSIDLQGYGLYIKQLFGLITHGRGENYVWSTNEEGCFNVGLLIVFCEILTFTYIVNLFILWKKGNKSVSPVVKWEGNLLAIDKASYNEGIQVRYIEPWYWRVSEIISIMVLAGLIAYLMTKKLD